MRLFRLARLVPPVPRPEGSARSATSNALYERLGYRAVEDRVVLAFEPPVTLHP